MSRPLEHASRGEAALPSQETGSVGALLQKPKKFCTEEERDDFEREFKQKVISGFRGVFNEEKKSLLEWTEEQVEDRRQEASERRKIEHEDSISQRCRFWDKMREPQVFLPLLLGAAGPERP